MKSTIALLLVIAFSVSAQVKIYGLRAYANDDEYRPPVIMQGEQVTIEFDITISQPPDLRIVFRHASKDWVVDDNLFVNDPPKIRSEALLFSPAPTGIYHYTFRYKNSFPNSKNFVEFVYSGNYIYTIVDHGEDNREIASGKFIVAENAVPVSMTLRNIYHSDFAPPMNQVNQVTVNVAAPSDFVAGDINSIQHSDVTVVDIIRNWDLEHPERIDVNDRNPETFVDDFIHPNKTFSKRDLFVGNEYRRLDLSSIEWYPNNTLVLLHNQPDVSRFQWQSKPDANGASKLKAFTGSNSDYLEVIVRLRLPRSPGKKIFFAGSCTQWQVLSQNEMKLDSTTGLYILRQWLRRGVYDYQYVLGDIGEDGTVIDQDWYTLEGNDWRTINRYIALVYYRDRRFGGFDRVVGFVRGRNPGTNESGKAATVTGPVMQKSPPVIKMERK
ncbi:MAG: type IX secretion system plug protein domain-containing protein [Bacteroidota bacterium]